DSHSTTSIRTDEPPPPIIPQPQQPTNGKQTLQDAESFYSRYDVFGECTATQRKANTCCSNPQSCLSEAAGLSGGAGGVVGSAIGAISTIAMMASSGSAEKQCNMMKSLGAATGGTNG